MTEKEATLINLNSKLQDNLHRMHVTLCKRLDLIWLYTRLPKSYKDHPLLDETHNLVKKIIELKFGKEYLESLKQE